MKCFGVRWDISVSDGMYLCQLRQLRCRPTPFAILGLRVLRQLTHAGACSLAEVERERDEAGQLLLDEKAARTAFEQEQLACMAALHAQLGELSAASALVGTRLATTQVRAAPPAALCSVPLRLLFCAPYRSACCSVLRTAPPAALCSVPLSLLF